MRVLLTELTSSRSCDEMFSNRSTNLPLYFRLCFLLTHQARLISLYDHLMNQVTSRTALLSAGINREVDFSGIWTPFLSPRPLCFTTLFGIISYPFFSPDSIYFTAASTVSPPFSIPGPLSFAIFVATSLPILALCRPVLRSASVKRYLENFRPTSAIVC